MTDHRGQITDATRHATNTWPCVILVGWLLSAAPTTAGRLEPATDGKGPDESIVMKWSSPTGTSPPALSAWYLENGKSLARVERAWASLLRRMAGHHPSRFAPQCAGLADSLDGLDEATLLPVPDPVIDLYTKRLLRHLHSAAHACRSQELFNVVYHLEEARASLTEMRWLLAGRYVTGRSSTLIEPHTPSHRDLGGDH